MFLALYALILLMLLIAPFALIRWGIRLFGSPLEDSIWRPFISLLCWTVPAYLWFQILTAGRDGGHAFGMELPILQAFFASMVFLLIALVLGYTAPTSEQKKD